MKRKLLISVLMMLVLTVSMVAVAFAEPADAVKIADTDDNAETTAGEDVIVNEQLGIEIDVPASYLENQDKVYLANTGGQIDEGFYIAELDLYPVAYDELVALAADDPKFAEISDKAMGVVLMIRANDANWTKEAVIDWCNTNLFVDAEKIELATTYEDEEGTNWSCYVYKSNTDEIPEDLDEELKPVFESIVSEIYEAEDSIRLIEMFNPAADNTGKTLTFETTDVDGNAVTSEEIFAGADYTMVNCWASWCGPCIRELPEIEEMSKEFKEKGGQVIGILMDGNLEKGLADGKDIMAKSGVTYLNIINTEEINTQVKLTAYPTTYFVDSNGVIVADAVIGADPESYITTMNELLGE